MRRGRLACRCGSCTVEAIGVRIVTLPLLTLSYHRLMTIASIGPGDDPFKEICKQIMRSLQRTIQKSLEQSSISIQLNKSLEPLIEAQRRHILATTKEMARSIADPQLIEINRAIARQMHATFLRFDLGDQLSMDLSASTTARIVQGIEEIEERPDAIPVTDTPIVDDEGVASIAESASNFCQRIGTAKNLTAGTVTVVVFAKCFQFVLEHPEVQEASEIALGLPTTLAMLAWLIMQQIAKKK